MRMYREEVVSIGVASSELGDGQQRDTRVVAGFIGLTRLSCPQHHPQTHIQKNDKMYILCIEVVMKIEGIKHIYVYIYI